MTEKLPSRGRPIVLICVYGLVAGLAAVAFQVGMSACLGAVVRAPVTGILIVFEMTHEFSLVPALMVVMVDRPGGQVLGVVTLHDVLRAEAAMAEAGGGLK